MVPTPEELQDAERTLMRLHPEWWADPHYRLHRKYGWRVAERMLDRARWAPRRASRLAVAADVCWSRFGHFATAANCP